MLGRGSRKNSYLPFKPHAPPPSLFQHKPQLLCIIGIYILNKHKCPLLATESIFNILQLIIIKPFYSDFFERYFFLNDILGNCLIKNLLTIFHKLQSKKKYSNLTGCARNRDVQSKIKKIMNIKNHVKKGMILLCKCLCPDFACNIY